MYVSIYVTGNVKSPLVMAKIYVANKTCKKSVARSISPCGEIYISEKAVPKSTVAKLWLAKSEYIAQPVESGHPVNFFICIS